jgi:hypothetical protein
MAINKEWKEAQQNLIDAAMELNRVWEDIDSDEVDECVTGYPPCLPSFDEFVLELIEWGGATETMTEAERQRRHKLGIIAK